MVHCSERAKKRKIYTRFQSVFSILQKEHDTERASFVKGGTLKESKGRLEIYSIGVSSPVILLQLHHSDVKTLCMNTSGNKDQCKVVHRTMQHWLKSSENYAQDSRLVSIQNQSYIRSSRTIPLPECCSNIRRTKSSQFIAMQKMRRLERQEDKAGQREGARFLQGQLIEEKQK